MRTLLGATAIMGLLLGAAAMPASAKTLDLNFIPFPERRTIDLEFNAAQGAPDAKLQAEVVYRDGQASIELAFERMKPAILFGGDVTCYVVWAVSRDGSAENLGELIVREGGGKLDFATARKEFALLVTAEPFYLVRKPSELVMFHNRPAASKRVSAAAASFSTFAPAPQRALTSIREISWDSKRPMELIQAEKAMELATRHEARTHASEIYLESQAALAKARELSSKSSTGRQFLDFARRSVALSNEAINIALRRQESIELERRIEQRRAEMAALEARAAEAEATGTAARNAAAEARAQVANAQTEMQQLIVERNLMKTETQALQLEKASLETATRELEAATQRLQTEKAELSSRLEGALSSVAETRNSARGFVVNLPDILFDVNQATLKPEAKLVLAKLAGILLIMPDLSIRIEGHTDSTGSAEYNRELSNRRALSVSEFFAGEGVRAQRLSAAGFGMDQPVADNTTAEGRKKNRRVEIVISERKTS